MESPPHECATCLCAKALLVSHALVWGARQSPLLGLPCSPQGAHRAGRLLGRRGLGHACLPCVVHVAGVVGSCRVWFCAPPWSCPVGAACPVCVLAVRRSSWTCVMHTQCGRGERLPLSGGSEVVPCLSPTCCTGACSTLCAQGVGPLLLASTCAGRTAWGPRGRWAQEAAGSSASAIPSAWSRSRGLGTPAGSVFPGCVSVTHWQRGSREPVCAREQLAILVFLSRTRLEGPMCPLSPPGAAARVTKRPVAAAAEPSPRGAHPRSPPPLLPPKPLVWVPLEAPSSALPCRAPAGGGREPQALPKPKQTFLWSRVPSSSAPLSFLSLPSRWAWHRGGAQ